MKATKLTVLVMLIAILGIIIASLTLSDKEKKTHNQIAGKPDLKANANDLKKTIITPHLEQSILPGTNILWCNTFQLAWNELIDLTGGPIVMDTAPPIVSALNKKSASKEDLDEASYVAMAGLASDGIYEKIRKELAEKFRGQASPNLFDASPTMEWVTYAYLFKQLPFQWAFTRFHENLKFEGKYVDSFGIYQLLDSQRNEKRMAGQVVVLDHRNNNDLIIELKTQAEDERLILAKIPPEATLEETIDAVDKRIQNAKPVKMGQMENLFVPVLNFEMLREYSGLCGRPIHTSDKRTDGTSIAAAAQSIRFRLDETGAVLKSEALTTAASGSTTRNLVFDKPFLILLKRRDAKRPYFALWIGNTELLVTVSRKPI
jgi:hypothetical protein